MQLFLDPSAPYEAQIADKFSNALVSTEYRFEVEKPNGFISLVNVPTDRSLYNANMEEGEYIEPPERFRSLRYVLLREKAITPLRAKEIVKKAEPGSTIVVSRFIGQRASDIFWEAGISYVDTYGNYGILCDNPLIRIRNRVLTKDPDPPERSIASLRGPRNAAIILALYKAPESFKVRTIAERSGANIGNVSRLLQFLAEQGLAEKNSAGEVVSIDKETLLRSWSEAWNPFGSDTCYTYVAPYGTDSLLKSMSKISWGDALSIEGDRFALSGAQSVAEYAATYPSDVVKIYADDPFAFAQKFDLVQTNVGARILIAKPKGDYPFKVSARPAKYNTMILPAVAVEAACADLLNGPGREPSLAEDVIAFLKRNNQW